MQRLDLISAAVTPVVDVCNVQEFVKDLETMEHIRASPAAQSFAEKELMMLEMKFNLHELLNREFEKEEMKVVTCLAQLIHQSVQVDLERVIKVDTHLHAASCATARHLLSFIKHKIEHHSQVMFVYAFSHTTGLRYCSKWFANEAWRFLPAIGCST